MVTLLAAMRPLDPAPLVVRALVVSAKVSHESIDVHVDGSRNAGEVEQIAQTS